MGLSTVLWVALGTILTVIYLNYPAPQLSTRLKTWLKTGKFFQYKEHAIFYKVEDGIPTDDSTLLCIHGFPTSGHDWSKMLDGLKEEYSTIIIPDMLGFGFSDKPKNHDYPIMEQADILEAILVSMDIKEAHVISHDYGDTVALELLHRRNNNEGKFKVLSLCMTNGGVFPETNFPKLSQKVLLMPYLGDFLTRISFYQFFRRGLSSTFGEVAQPTEEDSRDFYAALRHKDGNIVMSRLIHYITQRGVHKDRWIGALQTAKVPVHMVYGPADPVNPPVFIQHYKKTVPNPSIDVLKDGIGHYPQWEDPSGVMRSYANFLKKINQ